MKPSKPLVIGSIADKWFLFAIAALLLSLYLLSFRPTRAVRFCHSSAQESAKSSMQARLQQNPQNQELQRAAQAGLFIEQDYATFYRNCIRNRGYEPSL
ncbi:MAG TPA: hypothetical protein VJB10_01770 [Candidatus Peribacteraceae bacterium]|nr:hypothetical protein [Candidatus Peribacteraceae bacterium]